MERLYQLYFKIVAIHPFGELDWGLRRFLGALFNGASSKADMKMIHQLSENRDIACLIPHGRNIGKIDEKHVIDVAVLSPNESLNRALENTNSPYILLSRGLAVPPKGSLEKLLGECLNNDTNVAVWELSPSLWSWNTYVDPITLEVPCSTMELAFIRRDAINAVGDFDTSISPTAQALDMGYRLRNQGYRLIRPTIAATIADENETTPPRLQSNVASTKWEMRKRYSKFLNGLRGFRVKPSRLWRQGYEIGFCDLHATTPLDADRSPTISIIIRTYAGRRHWLHQSLSSALNQTYPKLEILIVEDGSRDYEDECKTIQTEQDTGGKIIRYLTQEKLGKSSAGNLALENSTGEYICFLDDDDLFYPHHIEELFKTLRDTPSNPAAYSLAWEVHTRSTSTSSYREEYYEVPRHTRGLFSRKKLAKLNFLPIQSVLFQRELFAKWGGFESSREFLEDWDLWLRYSQNAEFTHLPRITSLYRTTADPYQRIERVKLKGRRSIAGNGIAA